MSQRMKIRTSQNDLHSKGGCTPCKNTIMFTRFKDTIYRKFNSPFRNTSVSSFYVFSSQSCWLQNRHLSFHTRALSEDMTSQFWIARIDPFEGKTGVGVDSLTNKTSHARQVHFIKYMPRTSEIKNVFKCRRVQSCSKC